MEDKVKLIMDHLKVTFDRKKSYDDLKYRAIEYVVGDFMFLKVSSWKKVLNYGHMGKLSSRFIRPYEVLEHIGPVAYRLRLPYKLECIHAVFHVWMLRKYRSDAFHVIMMSDVEVHNNLSYEEEPINILSSDLSVLRNKSILLVKVLWHNHNT
ncbi:uncharacterized protein LOC120130190 [Hibiscus syriacus]|uniref:uncharacterized protein LOC120130190 n=1 Tax=Hibiscus syriacus TaxID=106335 RepID=UPI00192047EB|nr:uncharacterized protein LOC120130190 [Hibiscus syriacus]